ncbi:Flavonoid 3',5'-hydroxylase [Morus notabilis]|uniref:Flavonoid 3',5'-hydroxylase n=1 Tax=Morus notabilis TaxID=981085 RepID=W9SIE6_9ROSA|nr:Flavonoid 3',5'-hydroxylase [Morus notabilis]
MEDLQSFLIVCLSCLVSTILVRAILTKTRTTARLPPSPPALPIIGHLHLVDRLPHQAFHKISNRYGPLIHLFLGSVPCVVVSSPEMAKEFLKTQETSFLNRPNRSVLNYLSYPWSDFVFAEFGPYWKFMKKLSMSRLLGGQTLDQLLPIRSDELRRLLKLILERANEKEAVEVGGELTKLTNNVFSRMIMSKRCAENDEEGDEIRKAVNETAELLGKFNFSDYIWLCRKLDLQGYWKKSKEIHEKFDKMMEKIIEEHQEAITKVEEKGKYKDVLGILLEILEDESSEVRLTRENIKAFVLVFGTDQDGFVFSVARRSNSDILKMDIRNGAMVVFTKETLSRAGGVRITVPAGLGPNVCARDLRIRMPDWKTRSEVFVAGTDTSAITIEWALAELMNHPNIMAKAREEIDSVVGKTRLVEESDIVNLPYIQAIVTETLRLHPAAPLLPRESSEKCTINGYEIPAKTQLYVNLWAIGRDPKHWEDPLEFNPERFLSEEGTLKNQLDVRGQNFHLLPFGSGRRVCPGASLALRFVTTSLAAMIQCFEWKVDGKDGPVIDMQEGPGLTLPRAHPLICVPISRLSPLPIFYSALDHLT